MVREANEYVHFPSTTFRRKGIENEEENKFQRRRICATERQVAGALKSKRLQLHRLSFSHPKLYFLRFSKFLS
jgi:hypothetical protein